MCEIDLLQQSVTDWLADGEGWLAYRTQLDLPSAHENASSLQTAREMMLKDEKLLGLIKELYTYPGSVLNNHKKAGHILHKLVFIADVGFSADDALLQPVFDEILSLQSSEGPFQMLLNVPKAFGGDGLDKTSWMLCDTASILYALAKMGMADHPAVLKAADALLALSRDNGFPCAADAAFGKFHGPGRRDDPCPYANLLMLKALVNIPARADHPAVQNAMKALLTAWQQRKVHKPYMFGMGTDFCKLKAPLVWYDLLHVLDVLSQVKSIHHDATYQEMLAVLMAKMDATGRFTPESVWMDWKDWEFGQKKTPSRWVTLLAWRIMQRNK